MAEDTPEEDRIFDESIFKDHIKSKLEDLFSSIEG